MNVLDDPSLDRLWTLAREKVESYGLEPRGVVVIADPMPDERTAVAGVLGLKRTRPGALRVTLTVLDRELRSSRLGIGLVEALERRFGRLRDLRAEHDRARRDREQAWAAAQSHPLVSGDPALQAWLDDLRTSGMARRLGRTTEGEHALLHDALRVLEQLPRSGGRLGVFASELFGDAHALDHTRAVGAVVLRALAHRAAVAPPGTARERRTLWTSVGVLCDELSTDVLALNMPAQGDSHMALWLSGFARVGEPVRVTLRQLRTGWRVRSSEVFVCENPALVAEAADRLGASCPPLVCVEGMPTTAAHGLLQRFADDGALVRYHGDFDWGGIRAANSIAARISVEPWRFGSSDYHDAASSCAPTVELRGTAVDASWDADLRASMVRRGVAVYEEQLLDTLMADLERAGSGSPGRPRA